MKHGELIRKMTLAEKCALLSGQDVWHTRRIERLGIDSIALSDGPSGLRKQAAAGDHLGLNASTSATCIPSAATLANSWSAEVAESMGAVVGRDAAAQDVQVLLGPGLNTKRSPLCGRSFEYYSEDPYLAGKMAAGFIRGVQGQGVSACAKHFAVNSQELLRMANDSVLDERTLREIYLTNFEIAIKEGQPDAVMTSYNRVNGTYANENAHLYRILREEWGFDGMVVTDWGGSNDFVEGVRTGMNLEMPAAGDDSPCQLLRAVKEGVIEESIIDERVDALLELILRKKPVAQAEPMVQHERARQAAEKCVVLLKNEGNILPLAHQTRVAVIGDFAANARYQGAGSSMVNAVQVDNTLGLVTRCFPNSIGYAQGFERQDVENEAMAKQALTMAADAECVLLYMGLPEGMETEGLDRTHMRLPQNQTALLQRLAKVNSHIVVVLSCGSAVEMPWLDQCQALLWGGLGGEAAADAMLRVISGEVNPGGKLAETFPLAYQDMPVSRYYPGREYTSEYREGLYVGYRYFITAEKAVCFPFGFGLSYTSFRYDALNITEEGVSFDLTNTGHCAGDEVVQLYIALPEACVFRPARELKGFARVSLEPGETKRVHIPFDAYTFRYFNVSTNRFETEEGCYEIQVGASSQDLKLRGSWLVKGTTETLPYTHATSLSCYRSGQVEQVSDNAFETLLGHSIPKHSWDRGAPLQMNDTVAQMKDAKNPIARLIARMLRNMVDNAVAAGKPDLNLLFIYNIPFRGMAKMMNGMVSMAMAEDILMMVNGHFFRGCGRLIHHFFHRPKLKELEQKGAVQHE